MTESNGQQSVNLAMVKSDRWSFIVCAKKATALILPWGIIEAALASRPNIGFSSGLFVGVACFYFVKPHRPPLWLLFLFAFVVSIGRLVLVRFHVI